jgi:outer membrane lipoprotein-sorting protein
MKCPEHSNWDLLAIGALDDAQAEVLREHANACDSCRSEFLAARRAHVDRLRRYEALDRDHDQRREELLAALPDSVPSRAQRSSVLYRMGEFVMSINRTTPRRVAAVLVPAACVAIAAILLLSPGTQKSAFAAAIERLRQAKTIVAHFEAYMNDGTKPMQSGTLYLSDEHGMRFDAQLDMAGLPGALAPAGDTAAADPSFSGMAITHRPGEPVVLVHSGLHFAVRMHTPDGKMSGWSGGFDQSSPDQFLSSLRRMTGEADASLGRSIIDGREVEGFEVSAKKLGMEFTGRTARDDQATPPGHARLWVDAGSHLPVRMEVEITAEMPPMGAIRVRAVYDRFEFDRALDESLFDAKIPDDARVLDVNVPAPTEETLLSALKLFGDTLGRYPSTLDPSRISAELMVGLVSKGGIKLDPSDPAAMFSSELFENAMRVAMASAFVQKLAHDGFEPEYFGDSVRPEDTDEVLIRWRLADGQSRVIDGGLRVQTIAR